MVNNWQKNFKILWMGSFITELGNAMTLPFMALFIKELGDFTAPQLNFYAALAFSLTYLFKALVSPIWGRLADTKGRKLMCLRASGVMTVTILMVGLSPNVWWLLFFRALQGAFSGYINNANALMSVSAPTNIRGRVMSKLVTGSISGTLLGPLIGGIIWGFSGYRGAFFIVSGLMALVFVSTLIGVVEDFKPRKNGITPAFSAMKTIGWPFFVALFVSFFAIQASTNTITPVISLFVRTLLPNPEHMVIITGITASAPGLATILMAGTIGTLIDRAGSLKSLITFLCFAVMCLILTAFVQNVWQLIIFRFLLGVADAALIPALQVLTVQNVPERIFGRVFSYNQSAQASGNVIGPIFAAGIANIIGYKSIFIFAAVGEVVALGTWIYYLRTKSVN